MFESIAVSTIDCPGWAPSKAIASAVAGGGTFVRHAPHMPTRVLRGKVDDPVEVGDRLRRDSGTAGENVFDYDRARCGKPVPNYYNTLWQAGGFNV